MIQFVYYTDPHAKGVSPSTRIDDFPRTVEAKLQDIFAYGHEQNVDFFACSGDFVDSPYVSASYMSRLGEILASAGKPHYYTWGNHDMMAWNPSTIQDTTIGLFAKFQKDFHLLTKEPTYVTFNGQEIALTGVSAYASLDRTITVDGKELHRSRDYIVKKQRDVPHVHIVHGFLSPRPILEDIRHTVVSEIEDTEADLTLTGHDHNGFPLIVLPNGQQVINPGGLSRVFASHSEMNRMPQFLHVVISDDGSITVKPIQSRIALKGHEVMDRSLLDEKKMKEELLKATKGSLKEVLAKVNIEKIDLKTIVSRFKEDIEPEIYEEVTRRLGI